jgi:hypothetical protein
MQINQVVNTSIDGSFKRALIPFQVPNAKHWFEKHRKAYRRNRELRKEVIHVERLFRLHDMTSVCAGAASADVLPHLLEFQLVGHRLQFTLEIHIGSA